MDVFAIAISLIASAVAALTTFIVSYKQRLERQKENKRQKELSQALRVSLSKSFQDYFAKYGLEIIDKDKTDYILRMFRNYLVHYPSLETKTDIEEQVNARVNELKKRIEGIEARFPKEATLEKIASVNDAILATQLEAISESINVMRDNMLTKWDVAKVVFSILAALGVIVAIIFALLNWLRP